MFAPGTVTLLATDVPFGSCLGVDVVIHRVAAITKGTSGPLKIIGGIKRYPPVLPGFDEELPPHLMCDVPLCGFHVIIVANLFKITLLPDVTIHELDVILGECDQRVRF